MKANRFLKDRGTGGKLWVPLILLLLSAGVSLFWIISVFQHQGPLTRSSFGMTDRLLIGVALILGLLGSRQLNSSMARSVGSFRRHLIGLSLPGLILGLGKIFAVACFFGVHGDLPSEYYVLIGYIVTLEIITGVTLYRAGEPFLGEVREVTVAPSFHTGVDMLSDLIHQAEVKEELELIARICRERIPRICRMLERRIPGAVERLVRSAPKFLLDTIRKPLPATPVRVRVHRLRCEFCSPEIVARYALALIFWASGSTATFVATCEGIVQTEFRMLRDKQLALWLAKALSAGLLGMVSPTDESRLAFRSTVDLLEKATAASPDDRDLSWALLRSQTDRSLRSMGYDPLWN